MKIRKILKTVSVFIMACLLTFSGCVADAHPGRLDANGGHWNRKTGEYHYHRGPNAVRKKATRKRRKKTVRRRRAKTRRTSKVRR